MNYRSYSTLNTLSINAKIPFNTVGAKQRYHTPS